ncbi:MAG: hypothetical protein IPP74_11255 [Alphaproteobacteria bacterium]|nr:hypothetical protein [Alphaproteobacteria bacterium]
MTEFVETAHIQKQDSFSVCSFSITFPPNSVIFNLLKSYEPLFAARETDTEACGNKDGSIKKKPGSPALFPVLACGSHSKRSEDDGVCETAHIQKQDSFSVCSFSITFPPNSVIFNLLKVV